VKADILGRNYARLHGIDLDVVKTRITDDDLSRCRARGLVEPWSRLTRPAEMDALGAEVRL